MAKVLLVGEADQVASCAGALATLDLEVTTCTAKEAAKKAQELAASVIAVTPFADDALAPKFLSHLTGTLRERCPPVVLAIRSDPQARDACLIAGAADVVAGGQPEAFAARVESVANGWLRRGPRRQLPGVVRAQRARELLELQAADIDHSGLGLSSTQGVAPGQLLRLTLALPNGAELLVWGRVAQSDDGPGVRFLGLSPHEHAALVSGLQGRPAVASAPPAAVRRSDTPVAPGPPVSTPPPAVVRRSDTPVAPGPPVSTPPPAVVRRSDTPVAPGPPVSTPPPAVVRRSDTPVAPGPPVSTPPPAAVRRSDTPVASTPTASQPARTPVLSPPAPAAAPVEEPKPSEEAKPATESAPVDDSAPPEQMAPAPVDPNAAPTEPETPAAPAAEAASKPPSSEGGLGEAIDELLAEEKPSAEADVLASLLDTALEHRWPTTVWDTDACLEVLQTAASLGLAGETEGAPDGEVVINFLKTVTPLEKRVFDEEPPTELPPPEVSTRCLALRLRMFALVDDATRRLAEPDVRFAVDEAPLKALKAEVDAAGARVQEMVNGLMAAGQAKAIRDVSAFSNALNKGWNELKVTVARLRGEQVGPEERAVLLDVAEEVPGETPAARRPLSKLPEKLEPKKSEVPIGGRVLTPQQRARRRMVVWGLLAVVGVVVKVLTLEPVTERLDGASLGIAGVIEVAIPPGATDKSRQNLAATVWVVETWQPEEPALAKIKDVLRKRGVSRFVVMTQKKAMVAMGRTGPADRVRIWSRR